MISAAQPFTVRPANGADYEEIASLVSEFELAPVTSELLRQRDARCSGVPHGRWVAERDRVIVGHAVAERQSLAGRFSLSVVVRAEHRGGGIGTSLLRAAEAFAEQSGGTVFDGGTKDSCTQGQRFAERQGYSVRCHLFESAIDTATFEPAPHLPVLRRLLDEGISFVPFSETDGGEAAQRKLYEINIETARDNPGNEPGEEWPFDQCRLDVFESHWFRPECQILAMEGSEVVGLGAIGELGNSIFYHTFTGVRREYRGRGIALALKVLGVQTATRLGAHQVITHNDSTNAPMLAVNRKLGYVARPGSLCLRKVIA